MSKEELTEKDVIRYLEECNESQDILGFCYIPEKVCSKILDLYNEEKEKNRRLEEKRKNGTLSDGFHTYNDLYYQRCILFATICNSNKNIAWKSKKHSDGKKCFDSDNWFIVGIDTPEGSYTYHYEIKYWDMFDVQELEKGKEWDGHTEKDVTRILSLTNNYINKDKIREKIKKLENEFHFYAGRDPYEWDDSEFDSDRCDDIALQIKVLKELLEEAEQYEKDKI